MPHLDPRAYEALAPTVAHVDLGALRRNVARLQALAHPAPLMGVVKADAYGHGAVPVARVLHAAGVRHFAVATVPEAARLRAAGLEGRLLVLGAPLPDALAAYAALDLDATVASEAGVEDACGAARRHGPLRVHLKIDTGMGRLGLAPAQAEGAVRRLAATPGLHLAGLWTHLAAADVPGSTFTEEQLARFAPVVRALADAFEHVHVANSGGLLAHAEAVKALPRPLVRVGIALYGLYGDEGEAARLGLSPLMRLTTRVTQVKTIAAGTPVSYGCTWRAAAPTRLATLAAGYADGYPRALSNRAFVGLGGGRYGVAGRVCMDMTMVALGDPDGPAQTVAPGDEAVLFGPGGPSAFEVARWAGTIPYEITCGVAARVPRRYAPDAYE